MIDDIISEETEYAQKQQRDDCPGGQNIESIRRLIPKYFIQSDLDENYWRDPECVHEYGDYKRKK